MRPTLAPPTLLFTGAGLALRCSCDAQCVSVVEIGCKGHGGQERAAWPRSAGTPLHSSLRKPQIESVSEASGARQRHRARGGSEGARAGLLPRSGPSGLAWPAVRCSQSSPLRGSGAAPLRRRWPWAFVILAQLAAQVTRARAPAASGSADPARERHQGPRARRTWSATIASTAASGAADDCLIRVRSRALGCAATCRWCGSLPLGCGKLPRLRAYSFSIAHERKCFTCKASRRSL